MVEISPAAAAPHLDKQEEHADHTVLHPKPRLREKALVKVAPASMTDDADMIARAERAVEALEPSFAEWMSSAATGLMAALVVFEQSDMGPAALNEMRLAAQNVRGQAKQFRYGVVAQIATGLCDHLQGEALDVPAIVVRRYVEAAASVIRAGISVQANETALELARQLLVLSSECRARKKLSDEHMAQDDASAAPARSLEAHREL